MLTIDRLLDGFTHALDSMCVTNRPVRLWNRKKTLWLQRRRKELQVVQASCLSESIRRLLERVL